MSRAHYSVTLYHDEPDEAAVDTKTDAVLASEAAAIGHAKVALSDYWNSATVEVGHYEAWEPEPGVALRDFQHERVVWYIGPTWQERA